jgi:hypothetical protein
MQHIRVAEHVALASHASVALALAAFARSSALSNAVHPRYFAFLFISLFFLFLGRSSSARQLRLPGCAGLRVRSHLRGLQIYKFSFVFQNVVRGYPWAAPCLKVRARLLDRWQ